jgi:cardiolipin synthase (CMP-forming)
MAYSGGKAPKITVGQNKHLGGSLGRRDLSQYFQRARTRLSREPYTRILRLGSSNEEVVVRDRMLTWANAITVTRLLALPFAIWLIVAHRAWLIAIALLWTAALMDGADGYIARRFNQVTRLGTWLDPVADRVAMFTLALSLTLVHIIPIWLLAIVVARDLCVGALSVVNWSRGTPTAITGAGKLGTISLFFGLPGFVISRTVFFGSTFIYGLCLALTAMGIGLYYWSFIQYAKAAAKPRSTA